MVFHTDTRMLFNSYLFVFAFLPFTVIIYHLLRRAGLYKTSLAVLSVMSFVFYAYNHPAYLIILLFSILSNHLISKGILHFTNAGHRKGLLAAGIVVNIALIFYFKYFHFVVDNANRILQTNFHIENIALPLGISFFTFQQISYLVDSYRGETKDYNFIEYVAFVSFFPQLVAGPIVLHKELIPQFRNPVKKVDSDMLAHGIYIFAAGMFKKVIMADTLGLAVDWAWSNLALLSSLEIILVTITYTFQIYFDFSGYCDMAIGISKMFGLTLPQNFNSPYKATSILDFWKRWHMTLTRFLTQYIYIPMGGNRKGTFRTYTNILIVFLISGIWHGANWTFILWGILHGIAQVLNRIFEKTWNKCHSAFQWICTFCFVNVMWLLFRAESIGQAASLLKRIITMRAFTISQAFTSNFCLKEIDSLLQLSGSLYQQTIARIDGFYMWLMLLFSLVICLNAPTLHEKNFKPTVSKALGASVLLFWSIISFEGVSAFLYFNF